MDLPSDLIDLLSAFADEQVDYLLVGGQAVALHGVPRFTKDADLWLRDTTQNLERAKRALTSFGAPEGTLRALDEARDLDVVWMGHPPARIDLMKHVPGGDFEGAHRTRVMFEVAGVPVWCVSKAELIAQKRASGRPQDLLDAAHLSGDGASER
jgi:hypothetical protein